MPLAIDLGFICRLKSNLFGFFHVVSFILFLIVISLFNFFILQYSLHFCHINLQKSELLNLKYVKKLYKAIYKILITSTYSKTVLIKVNIYF